MIGVSNSLDWDGDASSHLAVLSQTTLTKEEVLEKMKKNSIVSDNFTMKIHQNEK